MYRKGPFIVLRLIGFLLFVGLVFGGGFMAYKAGVSQGIAQAPEVAEAIQQASENGQGWPAVPPMYGYGYGYGPGFHPYHHFGFFPFGIFGTIFLLFLFFGFMRMIFFRGMAWGHHGHWHGHHGRHWGGPPWMKWEDEENDKGEKPDPSSEEKK